MKHFLFLIFLAAILSKPAFSQSEPKIGGSDKVDNHVMLSLGGAGLYYSLSFERDLYRTAKMTFGGKAGLGTSLSSVIFPNEFNIPLGIYGRYGESAHKLELSLSGTLYFLSQYDYQEDKTSKEVRMPLIPSLAYRYGKTEGGPVVRLAFTPIINFNPTYTTLMPWGEISVGYSF